MRDLASVSARTTVGTALLVPGALRRAPCADFTAFDHARRSRRPTSQSHGFIPGLSRIVEESHGHDALLVPAAVMCCRTSACSPPGTRLSDPARSARRSRIQC